MVSVANVGRVTGGFRGIRDAKHVDSAYQKHRKSLYSSALRKLIKTHYINYSKYWG